MQTDTFSFIVRIWFEDDESEETTKAWRGSIERVGSDQRLYFYDLNAIFRFVEEQAGIDGHEQIPWWRSVLDWIQNEFEGLRSKLSTKSSS